MDDPTEYRLTPRFLRKHAEFICEQIDSNTEGRLFKCDQCGKLHLRISKSEALFSINTNKHGHSGYQNTRYVRFQLSHDNYSFQPFDDCFEPHVRLAMPHS